MGSLRKKISNAAIVAVVALVAGCTAMPKDRMQIIDASEALQRSDRSWTAERPPVTRLGREGYLVTQRKNPIPGEIAAQHVEFEMFAGATMQDLAHVLGLQSLPTIVRNSERERPDSNGADGDEGKNIPTGLSQQPAGIVRFNGTVRELAESFRELRNIEVEYRGRHLVFREYADYFINIPQSTELEAALVQRLGTLGAVMVNGDVNAGLIIYRADPETNQQIQQYVRHVASNAATVHLQVGIVSVRLEDSKRQGFDWGELAVRFGNIPGMIVEETGRALTFSSRGLQDGAASRGFGFDVEQGRFGVQAVIDALSEYGEANTDQDVTLSTLAGNSVRIESGREIPFVGELGAAFQGEGGGVFGQATVDTVRTGLDITIEPRYDAASDLVTSSIVLDISELLAMREFSAGGGGVLSAPELQILNFSNIARLRPGQSTLIGGVTFNQLDQDFTSVPGMEDKKFGGSRIRTVKSALFILLRPTITLFADLEENDFLPTPGISRACWDDVVPLTEGEKVRAVSTVYFSAGQHRLAREQRHHLWGLVRGAGEGERMAVVSYSDRVGSDPVNTVLRAQRAHEVMAVLEPMTHRVEKIVRAPLYCDESDNPRASPHHRRAEVWIIGREA